MRRLLLMRHAKSDWADPRLTDHARPLNARGQAAAITMGDWLRQQDTMPDCVLVSSARRALETWAGVQGTDPLSLPAATVLDTLYLADPPTLLETLWAQDAVQCILLIAHNPGLHELANQLAGPMGKSTPPALRRLADAYPTGAIAEFVLESWETVDHTARLQRFVVPRDLAPPAA